MKQVEGVGAIVDEEDAGIGGDGQAEEAARARSSGVVHQLFGHLIATGSRLDDVTVVAIGGQNMAVGGNGQAERVVDRAATGDGFACTGAA